MILYLDTSSLVKLYIEEEHSDAVRGWVEESDLIATGRITYPEAFSAVERRFRAGDLSRADYERVVTGIEEDWNTYSTVDFDERIAARMVLKHRLRGADAVHLSSAVMLGGLSVGLPMAFSSFDVQLNRSARAEGLHVLIAGT